MATTTPAPGDVTGQVASVVLKYTGPSGSDTKTFTTITNPITQVYNALRVGVYTFNATAYDGTRRPWRSSPRVTSRSTSTRTSSRA